MEPARVYSGRYGGGRRAFDMLLGGQGYKAVAVAGMFPAPSPPVCQGRYVPPNGCGTVTPRAAHLFLESRGSFGIQPLSRPSLYDQSGAPMVPFKRGPT